MDKGQLPVRTRFAPSPTGFMHVGGARTALFAWLVARQVGGEFLLRFEDTDRQRHVANAEKHIVESLQWLGLDWDNEIYRQSEKLDGYKQWAEKLISIGRAYVDDTDEQERDNQRKTALQRKRIFRYRDYRPGGSQKWDGKKLLRFKSEPRDYKWDDEVMGKLSAPAESIDDFVLMKSDGFPTYDFAHIVDDHEMAITHVMRSQEFASSVPKYLNLYEALEIDRPKLALLPYVLAPDGKKKLSKRDGAKDALQYRKEGYLPEAMINFLATLGWNDGTQQEIFSRSELIEKFSLARVQRSGAHFDEKRLIWMSGHYIRNLAQTELFKKARPFMPTEAKGSSEDYQQAVLGIVQERLKYLAELPELSRFFFITPEPNKILELFKEPVDKKLAGKSFEDIKKLLDAASKSLSNSDFSADDIASRLNGLVSELGSSPGELFSAVRIAISGERSTPAIFDTLSVLGKSESLERLTGAAKLLEEQA